MVRGSITEIYYIDFSTIVVRGIKFPLVDQMMDGFVNRVDI